MRILPSRRLTGRLIVAFWLVMTGWLVWREDLFPKPWASSPTTMAASRPIDAWMGLFFDQARVGTLHWQQKAETRSNQVGMALSVRSALTLDVLGKTTNLAVTGSAWRPLETASASFHFDIRSGDHELAVTGELANSVLRTEVHSAGEVLHWSKEVKGTWTESGGFGAPLYLPSLEVGEQIRISSFDPLTLRPQPARAHCVAQERRMIAGVERDTWVIELRSNGVESRAWVDAGGMVVRAETAMGLAFEVIAPDPGAWTRPTEATNAGAGLLDRTAVRPSGLRPFRGARDMLFDIRGVDTAAVPSGKRQERVAPGRYRVSVARGRPTLHVARATGHPALAADSLVQSEHPRIVAQAKSIIGDMANPWDQAVRIHEWVFTNVAKEAEMSVPSALEVLRTRRGDCNEHTVLFTALARSVGIPTRMAIGVVWSDELEGFYYHAWPEVGDGDTWIAMDPTLGQTHADATHIKLFDGGIAEWSAVLPFLGRLAIDIVEIE